MIHMNSNESPQHFASVAQMVAAMADPRYSRDDNYRAEVAQKIAASNARGVSLGQHTETNDDSTFITPEASK
jgi:hypothetical protein